MADEDATQPADLSAPVAPAESEPLPQQADPSLVHVFEKSEDGPKETRG